LPTAISFTIRSYFAISDQEIRGEDVMAFLPESAVLISLVIHLEFRMVIQL
jgi:hypothetical protein